MHAMIRWGTLLALILCVLAPQTSRAEVEGPQVSFSPHAGSPWWYSSIDLAEDILVGATFNVSPSAWFGFEGTVDYMPTQLASDPSVSDRVAHIGANALLNLAPYHPVSPFITAGWSQLSFANSFANEVALNGWEFGMGFKFRVATGNGKQVNLRLDARNIMTKFDSGSFAFADPSKPEHNMLITAGIEFAVGPSQRDNDADGVPDRRDYCTATPRRAIVDANGCATDADLDGVADGLDLCNNTPGGALVDEMGCATDSDDDGIVDGIDRCNNTPVGAIVDNSGCTMDGDNDGVADGIDQCPDTKVGISVDNLGCAADTDGDGVVDGIDVCLETPRGVEVDTKGCPVVQSAQEREFLDTGLIRLDKVYFESAKAELRSNSYSALDDVGRILVRWPQLKVEISGHTDSRGGEDLNQRLSEARAQSVFDYLARSFPGIKAGQFTIRGYGESRSIATNDTADGRSRNRRVEFQVLNKEMLSR